VLGSGKPYLIRTLLRHLLLSVLELDTLSTILEPSASPFMHGESEIPAISGETRHTVKMDVTSLLNANSMAATGGAGNEKKNDGSRPVRNRTPWDAGGYSLPIMSSNPAAAATTPPSFTPQPTHFDDSQTESPSPNHKFSDSRSSLSSFASSIQSASHSRFSSTSTVSGCYPLNNWASEVLSPKSTTLELVSPSNSTDAPSSELRQNQPTSTNEILETLSTIVELRTTPEPEQQTQDDCGIDCASNPKIPRPSSPSDAILIRRTTVPTLRLDTGGHDFNRPSPREM
jgi:hypothetical protein